MRTHIDTLADNTPKSRRRLRALGVSTIEQGQTLARQRERKEATRVALEKQKSQTRT